MDQQEHYQQQIERRGSESLKSGKANEKEPVKE
jgi:hypothetical protein